MASRVMNSMDEAEPFLSEAKNGWRLWHHAQVWLIQRMATKGSGGNALPAWASRSTFQTH